MLMRPFELIDVTTGELVPAITLVRRSWKGERYFMGFQEMFIGLASDKELTLEPKNVFLYLLGKLDFDNYIFVSQTQIANDLGMQRSHVSRAISLLASKGILLEGPKVNRSRTFRLNHSYGWKGKLSNLRALRTKENRKLEKADSLQVS
jgi:predicted transcriptional regulator